MNNKEKIKQLEKRISKLEKEILEIKKNYLCIGALPHVNDNSDYTKVKVINLMLKQSQKQS